MRYISKMIIILLLLSAIIFADENPDRQRQIEEFQELLNVKRDRYENLAGKEKDEIEKLRSIEEQIALSNQLILKIQRESERLKWSVADHNSRLKVSRKDLERKKQALYIRMKYVYKHGNRPLWLSLLSSGNPTNALAAFRNIKTIMEYDKQLVSSIESLSSRIETDISDMKKEELQLADFETEYKEELEFRKSSLAIRKELLDKIRSDKSEVGRAISDLEADAGTVSDIFSNLEEKKEVRKGSQKLPGLEKERGNLVWPIQGRIVRPYGSAEDKRGIRLTNPGIDIKGIAGASVLAAATGNVIYVSWLRGYGQFIILDHGGEYYTLYANLSNIYVETGDAVKAGEVIAEVGDIGSLEGSRLHFELRHKKDSLNPVRWLR